MAGHERANLFNVSIYQSVRSRGPEPDPAPLTEAIDYCADQIESMSDCAREPRRVPAARAVAVDAAARARRRAAHAPLRDPQRGRHRPAGRHELRFADRDPVRIQRPGPHARAAQPLRPHACELHDARQRPQRVGQDARRQRDHGRAASPTAPADSCSTAPVTTASSRSSSTGAQQIEIGADDSPFAINPWDVADPTDVSLEKIAFLVSLHGVMMGEEGLTTLERSQLGAAIRAVYARAAHTGETPRESMLRDELLPRSREEQTQGAIDVAALLRNLAERLGEYCGDGSYAYLLDRETTVSRRQPVGCVRHAALPGGRAAAGDVRDRRVRHTRDRAPPRRVPGDVGTAERPDVHRPHGAADRRGLASRRAQGDRRVRQRPRPPRAPPRPVPGGHVPAPVGLRHRARPRADPQLDDAAVPVPAPGRDSVRAGRAAAVRRGGRADRPAQDGQGLAFAGLLGQRRAREGQGRRCESGRASTGATRPTRCATCRCATRRSSVTGATSGRR